MFGRLFCLVPIVAIASFAEHRTPFFYPLFLLMLGFSVMAVWWESMRPDGGVLPLVSFGNAAFAIAYLMSERAEGRTIAPFAIPVLLLLAGFSVIWSFWLRKLQRAHAWLIFGFSLVFFVCYLSTGTGESSSMKDFLIRTFSLSTEQADLVTRGIRKTIHATFYGALASLLASATIALMDLSHAARLRVSISGALIMTLVVAISDEWRQTLVPNRTGQWSDVLLDFSGAAIFLFVWGCFNRIRSNAAPRQDQHPTS